MRESLQHVQIIVLRITRATAKFPDFFRFAARLRTFFPYDIGPGQSVEVLTPKLVSNESVNIFRARNRFEPAQKHPFVGKIICESRVREFSDLRCYRKGGFWAGRKLASFGLGHSAPE